MKLILHLLIGCLAGPLLADENWESALTRMPLDTSSAPLNRDNCMPLMLAAFQSNAVVKALIFLPGVADDFYLINRGQPKLNIRAVSLHEAIVALTNATALRASFRPPFLLLHLERDPLEPSFIIKYTATAARLKKNFHLPQVQFNDWHWQRVQPFLEKNMGIKFLPAPASEDAWHFNRHSLAAWNLSDWDVLCAVSLAGNTLFTVRKDRVVFEVFPPPR